MDLSKEVHFRPRVVVADDNVFFRSVVVKAVEQAQGIVVAQASDGGEALLLCQALRPDWLLTDYQMPCLNGFELTTALRKEFLSLQVVVLSQAIDEELRQSFLEQGVENCFNKNQLEIKSFVSFLEKAWLIRIE